MTHISYLASFIETIMFERRPRPWMLIALLLGALLVPWVGLFADDETTDEDVPPPLPFAVVNASSVDRLLTDVQYVFDLVERPELMDLVTDLLGNIKNLEGMDRTKPFGAMFFLDSGLPPTPFPVMYLPVEDEQKLLNTLTFRDNRWKQSGADQTRYDQISRPNLHLKFVDGYAFICRQSDWILDEPLPEPVAYNETLTSRYDVAAAARIGSIPQGIRQVFVGFFRASSEAELQQRDNESDVAYRMRRANGLQVLEFIEQLLLEGDQLTLGLDASSDARSAVVEFSMDAQPDSDFAKYLTDVSGTASMFHALADDTQPLTIAATMKLNERDQKAYREFVDIARDELTREISENEPDLPVGAVERMFDAVDATLLDGQIDVTLQFVAPEPDRFVILAVAKLVGARTAESGFTELMTALKARPDTDGTIDLNVASHAGVTFHRLAGDNASNNDVRLFGGPPTVYVGASDLAVWLAIGQDQMTELKRAIDLVRESAARAAPRVSGSPWRVTIRLNRWMQLEANDRGGRGPSVPRQIAEEAFAHGDDDALRLDVRPTEHGARIRVQFDEGFLRFIGLVVGRQVDQSQL